MTKSDTTPSAAETGGKTAKKDDRRDRAARALRENLKKRKQQIKNREKPPE
jgi:hypothetical protein